MSNAICVGEIGNYYGQLEIIKEGECCYWGISNYDKMNWEQIPESLYLELLKFENNKERGSRE